MPRSPAPVLPPRNLADRPDPRKPAGQPQIRARLARCPLITQRESDARSAVCPVAKFLTSQSPNHCILVLFATPAASGRADALPPEIDRDRSFAATPRRPGRAEPEAGRASPTRRDAVKGRRGREIVACKGSCRRNASAKIRGVSFLREPLEPSDVLPIPPADVSSPPPSPLTPHKPRSPRDRGFFFAGRGWPRSPTDRGFFFVRRGWPRSPRTRAFSLGVAADGAAG
jgi:hypothetical protein